MTWEYIRGISCNIIHRTANKENNKKPKRRKQRKKKPRQEIIITTNRIDKRLKRKTEREKMDGILYENVSSTRLQWS